MIKKVHGFLDDQVDRNEVLALVLKCVLQFSDKDYFDGLMKVEGVDVKSKDEMLEHLEELYEGVSNGFLAELYECLTMKRVQVVGTVTALFNCPCCGYQTLNELGDYDICEYCNWEDDGRTDPKQSGTPNRGSMEDYRKNIEDNPNYFYKEKWLKDKER